MQEYYDRNIFLFVLFFSEFNGWMRLGLYYALWMDTFRLVLCNVEGHVLAFIMHYGWTRLGLYYALWMDTFRLVLCTVDGHV